MQLTKIKFGTDGWRGVIADDFTFENVRRVAQATADYWNSLVGTNRAAIVGYDNRFLSQTYAKLVCEVLAANGIKALYPPSAAPTPAVTYAVRDRKLCGAVMITASHNPPEFNGYKLKAHYAGPADPEICAQVEAWVDRSPLRTINFDDGLKNGTIEIHDPQPAHVAAVKKLVDLKKIRGTKLRVVADSMFGCGGYLIESLLEKSLCRTQTIRGERNPLFGGINPEPNGKNLGALCDAVKKARAQIGLATDGDADRLGIVDDKGKYVSIQLVFSMLLLHLLRNRGQKTGLVVKSTNSTVLIDRICRAHGLKFAEVPVGFKYICEKMRETDVLIGGEESGGIGFQGHIPERDGILANLMLLEMLAVTGKRPSEIARELQKEFGASFYDRIDMHFPLAKREKFIETLRTKPPKELQGVPMVQMKDFDGVKYICKDDSWLMFRTSGTEPIIRIYSEASTDARVKKLLEHGQALAVKIAKA
ncbi:MAG: phosphoglucomutase/phosphomannomutase family protein [Verrucomicrobiia bacterium]|jgi:alpha-D-glucose phosphate-specific phosphoglucomutase